MFAWLVYIVTRKVTQRKLVRTLHITTNFMLFLILTFYVEHPLVNIGLRIHGSLLLLVLFANIVALVLFTVTIIAEYWFLKQSKIPPLLKRLSFIDEDDV